MPKGRRPRRRRGPRLPWRRGWTILVLLVLVGAIAYRGTQRQPIHHRIAKQTAAQPTDSGSRAAAERAAAAPAVSPSGALLAETTALPSAVVAAPSPAAPSPAAPSSTAPATARLAIIIDDCGQWPTIERALVALPYPITFSVLPRVRYGEDIAARAGAAGKGVMLHLPMETQSGLDPGPGGVTTAMSDEAIRAAVRSDLRDVPGAAGVNNHEGSRATADTRVMHAVDDVLAEEHRFFIDSRTSAASVAETTAAERGIPTARRLVFLDNVDSAQAVAEQLRYAATLARERGSAIAIGHPRAQTLAGIEAAAGALAANGITFVSAAELVH